MDNFFNIFNKEKRTEVFGVYKGVFPPYIISNIISNLDKTVLYIASDEKRAISVKNELEFFLGNQKVDSDDPCSPTIVEHIPWVDGSVYTDILPDKYSIGQRLGQLARIRFGITSPVIVTSIQSMARQTIPIHVFDKYCHLLGSGMVFERDQLIENLNESGYQRTDLVEDFGTYSVRGQVIDIYIPLYENPVRLTYFDDEIETIHFFDSDSQKRIREIHELLLHPVKETILSDKTNIREKLYTLADECGYPSSKTRYLLERFSTGDEFFGMETLTPAYHKNLIPLDNYFPENIYYILENPNEIKANWGNLISRETERYEQRKKENRIGINPEAFYLLPEKLNTHIIEKPGISFYAAGAENDSQIQLNPKSFALLATELKMARTESEEPLDPLKSKLNYYVENGKSVVLAVPDEPTSSPLVKILEESGFSIKFLPDNDNLTPYIQKNAIYARRGKVSHGFEIEEFNLALISEEELFGTKSKRGRKKKSGSIKPTSLEAIDIDDLVVHELHGIGKFKGILTMSPGGMVGEYLLIEYNGGDKLYLPAHKISKIGKFRGGSKEKTKLDKLGGKTWEKAKKKVTEKIKALAEQLLQLASERAQRKGFSFPVHDPLLYEFEATFPYEETQDQEIAISEVYSDMGKEMPMDRLVCGDVGYGKTEVALRAAVLAVLGGKQVALLAPTTLLVEQHYRTFIERLSSFPVSVGCLSRFQSKNKQKHVLQKITNGEVDIVVGTHRLLSKDIIFKDLGLLIIDEEQKFGVAQKEKFKFFKPNLDVLSLSATPIPRTLHMSVMGLKDISIITTPPQDRMAVRSYVAPTDNQTLKDAINRELSRGGQVFIVVPRVKGGTSKPINEWFELFKDLVPEANIAMAHGQMESSKLERIMVEFISGSYNVLVTTNIIESGLDITRANTIMIMDAHHFGLAQLYQLKGRVGRGKVRAFSYFCIPSFDKITPKAKKRLLALQRHTQLGSGFNLASEDLEIRGAGEVIGKKQSGTIATVGFDTYVEIVEEALNELRNEKPPVLNDPELNVDVSGYIPEEYIPEPTERLVFYRRLSTAENETVVSDHLSILEDRYGPMPDPVKILGHLMKVKTDLRLLNAMGLGLSGQKITIHLNESTNLDPESLIKFMEKDKKISFSGANKLSTILNSEKDPVSRLTTLRIILRNLISCVNSDG
jgi:transcription-repair coupling factor (superfamily II helicase)